MTDAIRPLRLQRDQDLEGRAKGCLEWMDKPYHRVFVEEYLRRNADEPVQIDQNLVANTARSNTFKEIVQYLHRLEQQARAALGD